jgi:hypothetical protein
MAIHHPMQAHDKSLSAVLVPLLPKALDRPIGATGIVFDDFQHAGTAEALEHHGALPFASLCLGLERNKP